MMNLGNEKLILGTLRSASFKRKYYANGKAVQNKADRDDGDDYDQTKGIFGDNSEWIDCESNVTKTV